jgi:hypothetical protein
VKVHGHDPRPELRRTRAKYIYSTLHAHQVALTANADPGTAALLSRSADGDLMVRAFHAMGVVPMRGSNHRGGADAIDAMAEHIEKGVGPAIIAVDGPRGPRGQVRKGVASLAIRTDSIVLNVVVIPRRRLVMKKAWDRFQVPIPFFGLDAYFAEPIRPLPGEGVESLRRRIEASLNELEQKHDPAEATAPVRHRMAA